MVINKRLFSKLHTQSILDGEKVFWLALSCEEPEEDGFFFFKYEDWIEKHNISSRTITRYLDHLEKQGLIIKSYRRLPAHSPYPINGGSTFLFLKVLHPEKEREIWNIKPIGACYADRRN